MSGISAGELCHRVTIQRDEGSIKDDDGYEGPADWRDFLHLWAKVTPLSARDLIAAQGYQSQVVARLKIRHRTDIDSSMRVIFQGIKYAIDGPALNDPETGNIYCTFLLSSGVEKFKEG
ncbi:phage head closure protein [Acinetobacter lactucae]|uniref:Phage head closure protein n=1 Tax=Acinetobacter lactucae TaxID=1785128 RepID=A0AB35K105_9GAMM|nr:phage head closure protein [Acinetobacter lactucae]MDD9320333.1 phage head closure protein [Acinetobacter lactucae]